MADLAITASIDRTSLSLSPLSINDGTAYKIVSAGPGETTWRRESIRSPFTDGEYLIQALKETSSVSLLVKVKGSSFAVLETNLDTLLRAMEQFEFQFTLTIEGMDSTWTCQPADYGPADNDYEKFHMMSKLQVYRFIIPKYPVPVAGPI